MARWLRGAWLTHAGESVLFLAGVGAALGAAGARHALAAPARALALAVLAHHVVLAFLGLTGRSLLYRYFVPDLVLGLVLAALGFAAVVGALVPAVTRWRAPLVAGLVLLAFGGALLDLRELGAAARDVRSRAATGAAAERCLAPWLAGPGAPGVVVVPSRLHGELTWRLREVPLEALLYEEWFFADGAASDAGEAGPVLWLGAAEAAAPARAAAARQISRCEGAASPLSVRSLAP
jgi:hypothetical protein